MKPDICPMCQQKSDVVHKTSHTDNGITYDLYHCPLCNAQFWSPLKNPGSEWYERDDRYSGANSDPTLEPNWNHRAIIHFLKPFKGKVLDIGSGTGNFLSHASKEGWQVWGIDFNHQAVKAATEVFGLPNIEVNDLKGFNQKNNQKFDLITFFDVFEHIDNHNEFIDMVKDMLADKGYIAMSMPYRGGARWLQPYDLPPRHLTRWDRESLRTFLERKGFTIKYMRRAPATFFYIVMKLRFRYGKYFSFGLVSKIKKSSVVEDEDRSRAFLSEPVEEKRTLRRVAPSVNVVHTLAKIKDILIFGIPAAIIWLVLLPSEKRYNGLYAIAQK